MIKGDEAHREKKRGREWWEPGFRASLLQRKFRGLTARVCVRVCEQGRETVRARLDPCVSQSLQLICLSAIPLGWVELTVCPGALQPPLSPEPLHRWKKTEVGVVGWGWWEGGSAALVGSHGEGFALTGQDDDTQTHSHTHVTDESAFQVGMSWNV